MLSLLNLCVPGVSAVKPMPNFAVSCRNASNLLATETRDYVTLKSQIRPIAFGPPCVNAHRANMRAEPSGNESNHSGSLDHYVFRNVLGTTGLYAA
jgi:hypothetical protein